MENSDKIRLGYVNLRSPYINPCGLLKRDCKHPGLLIEIIETAAKHFGFTVEYHQSVDKK